MTTSTQDAQWVLRAQCRDREALEQLLRAVQPSLQRYLVRLVGTQTADDLLQDVFITICRKLAWLRDPKLFRPWMFRIASRAAFRYLKRTRRRLEDPIDDTVMEWAVVPDVRLPEGGDLRQLLGNDKLSPPSRAVLVLHFEEEMTLAAIAAVLEIPLGTVKSRLASGLATLRKQLQKGRP